jgi:hypothetical protein
LTGPNREFPKEQCYSGLSVVLRSTSNGPRYGLTAKSCDLLLNDTNSLNNIFTKLFGSTTAGAVNSVNLVKAYQLFYPEETLPANFQASMISLGDSGGTSATNSAKWKLILLGLCVDPGWQSIF